MEEVIAIAENEIESTSQDAVRSVVAELGSELAYEVSLKESYENEAVRLEILAKELEKEAAKNERRKNLFMGIAIGEAVVLVSFVAFMVLGTY